MKFRGRTVLNNLPPCRVEDLDPELTPVVELDGIVYYALQKKQLEAFDLTPLGREPGEEGPEMIGYGGSAGGGKSHLARAAAVTACLIWPGCTGIIFRKTEGEVRENHVNKFRTEMPELHPDGDRIYGWNGEDMCATWFNKSKLFFGYLRLDDDVHRYQGPEYDFMIFEEATHYSWFMVNWLTSNRLRATTNDSSPFCLFPSNPGSKGHAWFKRLFIERIHYEDDGENPRDYAFVQSRLADNKILMRRDPKYAKRLDRLPEPWRSWQRDGDFSAGAGGAFAELERKAHLVKPFKIPDHWIQFGSFDWGYNHPFSFGHYAIDEDGCLWKLDTVTGLRLQPHEIVQAIKRKVPVDTLRYISAGHDLWSKRRAYGDSGETLWEYFSSEGIVCVQADTDRVNGYQNLIRYMAWKTVDDGKPGTPRLRFFDTPGNVLALAQLANMVTVEGGGEDVLKVDADERGDGGDDIYDETRYGAMSVRLVAPSGPEPRRIGGAFSAENLAHMHKQAITVSDDLPDHKTNFHPEFGAFT